MRYTVKELLAWGDSRSYPQLILSEGDVLKHGELHWHRMARNRERRMLAWKRIQMWQEYMQRAS